MAGVRLALPRSNYRATRCWLSSTLKDPACDNKKECWKDNLLPDSKKVDDLEDIEGYYKSLGCHKVSSDAEIASSFHKVSAEFKKLQLPITQTNMILKT